MFKGSRRSWLPFSAWLLLLACGGGGGGGGTTTPPPPPAAALLIEPLGASLASGTKVHLVATTLNFTGTPALAWTIQEAGMGQLAVASDGRSADYTAPGAAGTYHVTVSSASPALSAQAEVKVAGTDDSGFFKLQLTPYKMNMKVNDTARAGPKGRGKKEFIHPEKTVVAPASTLVDVPVVWSIAEGALGGAVVPTTGVYTAPSQPGVFHLVATAIENPRVQGSIEVRVFADTPPSIPPGASAGGSVAARPGVAYLEPLDQAYLKAVTAGTASAAVTWSLIEGVSAGALSAPTGGAENEVLYTATGDSGAFHALATAVSDAAAQAQITLQVGRRAGIDVVPGISRIAPGASVDLQALVSNTALTDVVWSSPDPVGGTLSPNGLSARFTAPSTPGVYYVSVQPRADLEKGALARIEVAGSATPSVKILPPPARIQGGTRLQLVAQVLGTLNTAVTWSTSAGSISPEGLLTAPGTAGPVTVTAKSVADATRQDTATLTVNNLPVFTTVPPVNANPTATYTYTPATTHPDALPVTITLVSGPTGATFNAGTVTWTPAAFQYELENQFVLKATDSQGGASFQRWTVNFRVFGQAYDLYYLQDGTGTVLRVAADLSAQSFTAFSPNGSGGWLTFNGSGTAAGNYWVPGVPPGNYWLRISDGVETSYGWLDASRKDIYGESMGRPNSVEATLSTPVTLNFTGMSPWSSQSNGLYTSAASGLGWTNANASQVVDPNDLPPFTLNAPTPGATTLSGTKLDWNTPSSGGKNALVKGSAGDRPVLSQGVKQVTPDGEFLGRIATAVQFNAFDMADGAPITLSGTFSTAFPTISTNLSLDLAALEPLRVRAHPGGVAFKYYLYVEAIVPSPTRSGSAHSILRGSTLPLMDYLWTNATNVLPTAGTISTGPLSLINPLAPLYQPISVANAGWRTPYLLPGTTTPLKLGTIVARLELGFPGGSLTPVMRPATLLVNETPAQVDRNGIGTTPTLRIVLDPADQALYDRCTVYVNRLMTAGSFTAVDPDVPYLVGPFERGLQLPPGLLQAGQAYVILVAVSGRNGNSVHIATSLSGILRP